MAAEEGDIITVTVGALQEKEKDLAAAAVIVHMMLTTENTLEVVAEVVAAEMNAMVGMTTIGEEEAEEDAIDVIRIVAVEAAATTDLAGNWSW